MQQNTTDILQHLGYRECHRTGDPNDALAVLASSEYELLLIDWDMPGLYGIEMLKAIRSSSSLCSIRVLMITCNAGRDKITCAASSGVNGYLEKPFSAQLLQEKIATLCEKEKAGAV